MLKILKYAEEKGKSEERKELIEKQPAKKFGKIPTELAEKIRSMDNALLDI